MRGDTRRSDKPVRCGVPPNCPLLAVGRDKRAVRRSLAALPRQLMADHPEAIIAALAAMIRAGGGIAGRPVRHRHSEWEAPHYSFTYCNAPRRSPPLSRLAGEGGCEGSLGPLHLQQTLGIAV